MIAEDKDVAEAGEVLVKDLGMDDDDASAFCFL